MIASRNVTTETKGGDATMTRRELLAFGIAVTGPWGAATVAARQKKRTAPKLVTVTLEISGMT
jgi:hypothetical protein